MDINYCKHTCHYLDVVNKAILASNFIFLEVTTL